MNEQSRNTGNIRYTGHRRNIRKAKPNQKQITIVSDYRGATMRSRSGCKILVFSMYLFLIPKNEYIITLQQQNNLSSSPSYGSWIYVLPLKWIV